MNEQPKDMLHLGIEQGITLEMLDTIFDVACYHEPECRERWMKLKEELHLLLVHKWLTDEAQLRNQMQNTGEIKQEAKS